MYDYEREYEEHPPEELELPAGEPQTFFEKVVAKTPWWAISVGAHALAVMILSFIVVFAMPLRETEAVTLVHTPPEKKDIIFDPPPGPHIPTPFIPIPETHEEPVWRKYAETADHNESDDDEDFQKMKGDSFDFVSDKPFKGKGVCDAIGAGGGGGGRFGGRLGGNRELATKKGGGPSETHKHEALLWLARHQNADGSWSTTGYTRHCNKTLPNGKNYGGGSCTPNPGHDDFDAGVTGLSLLAFLGAGYSHISIEEYDGICFGTVVRKGVQWLMSHQDPEGCIGSRNAQKYMYNHTLCALAITEAYGLTGSHFLREPAQRAVDFTVAAQNPGKGWRYSYKCGDNDSSVSGWAVMTLKSAELSNLRFPLSAYDGARTWFNEVTEGDYYRVGYTHKGTGKVYTEGNQHFNHHEALTSIAVMSRIFMDKQKSDPKTSGGASLLLRDLPRWSGNDIDFYYWYYASLALFQFDGPTGPKWRTWNEPMKNALVDNQNKDSCRKGSWETVGRWCGEGGRVYATAINALTLEVYYRYYTLGETPIKENPRK
ncbi:MAG: prenyltransferase/squalene oxidase repeat-containing protein [Planctomycetota bacterium]|jgi:hypothetical protein